MLMLNLGLATRGVNSLVQLRILQRHLLALQKHMTLKKFLNLGRAEYQRMMKKEYVTSYPYILKIETTNICNVHCKYCYDDRRAPQKGERAFGKMEFKSFKKIIDEIGEYLFKINLYGFGEPLLFEESLDMIRYATQRNIGVAISSNMNFNDATLPRRIVESGLEVLIFSCHGATQESYQKFMRGGRMQAALDNITRVVKERQYQGSSHPLIDWQYCVTRFNQDEVEDARRLADELGVDQIRFIKPIFPHGADAEWYSDYFDDNDTELADQKRFTCSWLYRAAYINYDGGVLPCCRDTRRMANDFGNVLREDFSTIWNNEKYRTSRRLMNHPNETPFQCETMCAQCYAMNVSKIRETAAQASKKP